MGRRLILSYLVVIMATILLLSTLTYQATRSAFRAYSLSHTAAHTELLPAAIAYRYETSAAWEATQADVSQLSILVGTRITVVDATQKVVAATRSGLIGNRISDVSTFDQVLPITTDEGELIGQVLVEFSQAVNQADRFFLSQFVQALLLAVVGVTIIAVGLSIYLARTINRPLVDLSRAARAVTQGDYAVRVEPVAQRSSLKRLGEAFNRMAAELGSVEKLRANLVSNVSHDLRTPLTVINGYLEGLRSGQIADRRTAETAFEAMHVELEHLKQMVNQLNQAAKVQTVSDEYQPCDILMAPFFDQLKNRTAPLAAARAITVDHEVVPEDLVALADPHLLEQAFLNLIENSIRHTPAGGTIKLTASRHSSDDRFLCLGVHDTGDGIPAEKLPYIFERFYRVDSARNRADGGMGLGLAIVKEFAESCGGRVEAASPGRLGTGTSVELMLPPYL